VDRNLFAGVVDPSVSPEIRMLQLASAHVPARALHVFASLGLHDALSSGPRDLESVARDVAAHPPTLRRLLRFLSTIEVVLEEPEDTFSLTQLGSTLSKYRVVLDNTLLMGSESYWASLGAMQTQVVTGANAFRGLRGVGYFEHLRGSSHEEAAIFDATMRSLAKVTIPAILAAYDFSRAGVVADIGGGNGALIEAIAQRYPSTRGMLFDAPEVIEKAAFDAGVAGRIDKVSGDFFKHVPGGADVYILRQILHDWDDESASVILRNCRRAIRDDGVLLIVEMSASEGRPPANDWAGLDLLMMLLMDGRERAVGDFRQILENTGFVLDRIVETRSPFAIVVAKPS
jgi:SAM-dependent methyltransferase